MREALLLTGRPADRAEVAQALGISWSVLATADQATALLNRPWDCVVASPREYLLGALHQLCCVILADPEELPLAWDCLGRGAQDVTIRGDWQGLREAVLKAKKRCGYAGLSGAVGGGGRDAYDQAPVPLLTVDSQGRIVDFNTAAAEFFNRPGGQLYGWPFAACLARECLQAFLQALHPPSPATASLRVSTRGGKRARLLLRPAAGNLQLAVLEEAEVETRNLQSVLEDSRLQRTLWDNLPDAFFTVSGEGRVRTCNPAASRLFQAAAHQLVGLDLQTLVPLSLGAREGTCLRPNGSCFPGTITVVPAGVSLRGVVVRDLTPTWQANLEFARVAERERRRMAQDLHDDLGQQLTALAYVAAVLEKRLLAGVSDKNSQLARRVTELSQQAVTKVRGLARGLYPQTLSMSGLVPALWELTGSIQAIFGVICSFQADGAPDLEEEPATHLYRLAQEALSNAVKHSGCQAIEVRLEVTGLQLELRIADDGCGLPPRPAGEGMGLRSMRQHAQLLGAQLEFSPGSPRGTLVVLRIPRARAGGRAGPARETGTPRSAARRREQPLGGPSRARGAPGPPTS